MKNAKLKISAFLSFLILIYSIQPVLAANQYSVNPGAQFRWDASKYIFVKDGLGLGTDLSYTHSYYLEFNFTDWGGTPGLDYLNGTLNINGTIVDGEISHELYYSRALPQTWATVILNVGSATYPVNVYLVCDVEIEQSTKPQMQTLDTNSWITFSEPSTNNLTLTGTYIDGSDVTTYTGNVEFNSDKVLKYLFDEVVQKESGVTVSISRYIWNLTYTAGTGPGDDSSIPGFQLIFIIGAMTVGSIFILKKYKFFKAK